MQQFTVPQFIDVEDKIIGPVTTRQFIIMLAGAVLIGVSYKIFDFSLFIVAGLIIFVISITLAFIRVNGRPFHYFILNMAQTLRRPGLRIWNQNFFAKEGSHEIDQSKIIEKSTEIPVKEQPMISRLNELSLIVDTQGAYKGEARDAEAKIEAVKDNSKQKELIE